MKKKIKIFVAVLLLLCILFVPNIYTYKKRVKSINEYFKESTSLSLEYSSKAIETITPNNYDLINSMPYSKVLVEKRAKGEDLWLLVMEHNNGKKGSGERRFVSTMCIGTVDSLYNFIDTIYDTRGSENKTTKLLKMSCSVSVKNTNATDLLFGTTNRKIDKALETIKLNLRYKNPDELYAFTWSIVEVTTDERGKTTETFHQAYCQLSYVWYFS